MTIVPDAPPPGSSRRRSRRRGGTFVRGASLVLASQWVRFIVQLSTTLLLARVLVPDDFGTAALVAAVLGFGYLLGESGLSAAAVQAENLSDQQASNLLWTSICMGAVLSGVAYALASPLGAFAKDPNVTSALQVSCVALLLQAAYAQIAAQRTRALQFSRIALAEVLAQVLGFSVALVLAFSGSGYWALVLQMVVVAAVQLICIVPGTLPWRLRAPARAPMGRLYRFGLDTLGVQTLTYGSNNTDTFAGSRFWSTADLGLYSRAIQLFRQPLQLLLTPLTRVVLPLLSRRQSDLAWLNLILTRAQRLIASVLGSLFAVLCISAEEIIHLALGDGWEAAVLPFQILVVGGIFQCAGYVYYWAFLVRAKTRIQFRASLLSRSLQIALICVAAPHGPQWVAVAVSTGLFLHWLLLSVLPMRHTNLDVAGLIRALALPLGIHAVLWPAVAFVHRNFLIHLGHDLPIILAVAVIYASFFTAAAYMSRTLRQDFDVAINRREIAP